MSRRESVSVTSGMARPDFKRIKKSEKDFKKNFDYAMYYVHYEIADKKLKEETVKYAKTKKIEKYEKLNNLDTHYFGVLGKACYLLTHGSDIEEVWQQYIDKEICQLIEKENLKPEEIEEDNKNEDIPVLNIQERMKEQATPVANEFDLWLENFLEDPKGFDIDKCDFRTKIVQAELKAGHVRHLVKFFESEAQEVKLALSGTDDQVNEGYSHLRKIELKKLDKFYDKLFADANMIVESSKTSRKPRKKKEIDKAKIVSKIVYMKEDTDLKLVSINPIDILGAKELWVYNTKTRKIGKYIALDEAGLSVKNATILNFSDKSTEKTLKKPKEQLAEFKKSSKVALRKYLDNVNTVGTTMKSRLNENHVLLKVEK